MSWLFYMTYMLWVSFSVALMMGFVGVTTAMLFNLWLFSDGATNQQQELPSLSEQALISREDSHDLELNHEEDGTSRDSMTDPLLPPEEASNKASQNNIQEPAS